MNYFQLVKTYTRFLVYAFTHAFFAGIGQTIVISFFIPHILAEFQLQNAEFGAFYSGATWLAALTLPFAGRKIDFINLRTYSGLVGITLVAACLIIGLSPNLLILFFGIVFLRLAGQSLMGHIAATTMARYFGSLRGRALGISGLGHPFGEAIFPFLATQLILIFGWRMSYITIAVLIALIFFPLTRLLVNKEDPFLFPSAKNKEKTIQATIPHFDRLDVLKTPFFYFVMPLGILPPFLATGFFLHNSTVAADKGWNLEWMATCVLGFSAFRVLGSFLVGPLIDRLGAKKIFPYHLIPMALGFLLMMKFNQPLIGLLYFSLFGISIGFEMNLKSALWAEVYGTKHLGGIRSMVLTIVIFSTGISPILFGWLIDSGVSFEQFFKTSFILTALCSVLAFFAPIPVKAKRKP